MKVVMDVTENLIEEIINGNSKIKEKILKLNNPRLLFLYAYYFQEEELDEISAAIIKSNDERYISFYFRQIKNINTALFFEKILEYDNKTIFYSLYDRKNLDDEYFTKGINKMISNGQDKYLFLTLYYYFVILSKFDKDMFTILKKFDQNIDENNYKNILQKYYEKFTEKIVQ